MKKGLKFLIVSFTLLLAVVITACTKEEQEEPVELSMPVITKVNDTTVSWTAIEYAVAYDVEVNNVVSRQTSTQYQVSEFGTYVIRVKAKAEEDSEYLDSSWSLSFTLSYEEDTPDLPKMTAPVVDKNTYSSIKWLPVQGAGGYRVYINGEAQSPDLAANVTSFNILYLGFGVYSLQVQTLPSNTTQNSPSNLSNLVQLELIDPFTFSDRLSLSITGKPQIIAGSTASYTVTVVDSQSADTSFLVKDIKWSIVSGNDFATVDNSGKVTAIAPGEVILKATHNIYPDVVGQINIEIVARPTIEVDFEVYQKGSNENEALVEASHAGTLYYIHSATAPTTVEALLALSPKQANVVVGDNEINIDLGNPAGNTINIYFVLEYKVNGVVVGYSNILALENIEMLVGTIMVSNAEELREALENNEEFIMLANDIELTGVWTQVMTVFTGTLDGDGHTIKNLVVEGGNTGMLRTLGNGAVIKNIIFEDAKAQNFSGANDAIFASTVQAGSIVTFENVAMINAQSISSVDGSGRSTHAALIANFNNSTDTTTSIRLTNVYIQYTHTITRTTDTANIGGIFGTFASSSPDGLILNHVYLDVHVNGINGKANNGGAIWGQGRGHVELNDSVIVFTYNSPSAGPNGLDVGYISSNSDTSFTGNNNLFITKTSALTGTWEPTSYVKTTMLLLLEDGIVEDFVDEATDSWFLDEGILTLNVADTSFTVFMGTQLGQVILQKNELTISWTAIPNAIGYQIYVDGVAYGEPIVATQFNASALDANTYSISVQAIGDQINYASGLISAPVEVTIAPFERLASPEIEINEMILSWDPIDGAISYKVYINGLPLSNIITETTFDLTSHLEPGMNTVQLQAIANPATHLDSLMSDSVEVIVKEYVTNDVQLKAALDANVSYIVLANDIELTGVWPQVTTIFTGTLDGDGHAIINLVVEGSATGMIKTLGNGATFKNITFINAQARNFSGANDGIIASTVTTGAVVTFENFAMINATSTSSVEGSSRSTHGALIATVNNASDTTTAIHLSNVYIQYVHHITRTTDTGNIGGLFGNFQASTPQGIVMNHVYIDFKVNGVNGKGNNGGPIWGQGRGHVVMNDSVIRFVYITPSTVGPNGIDVGYITSAPDTSFTGHNNLFISATSNFTGSWAAEEYVKVNIFNLLEEEEIESFINDEDNTWVYVDSNLTLEVNGQTFIVVKGQILDKAMPEYENLMVTWEAVPNAKGYQIYIDGVPYGPLQTAINLDMSTFNPGTYAVEVKAIGDEIDFLSGLMSDLLMIVIEPFDRLDTPKLDINGNIVSWDAVDGATGYIVYLNGTALEEILEETSIDLTDLLVSGNNEIKVQAIGNPETHLDSFLSTSVHIVIATLVSNQAELKAALDANIGYIMLANDIELTGVWVQVTTVFTGTLDGDGYSINGLVVEGNNTGMIKTLGNGSTIKNITFNHPIAQNFNGANDGIIANTVSSGAVVTFENVALVDAVSNSSVAGSSRSTHGALIATYGTTTDMQVSIRLTNVYIQYTHNITRVTDTANIGGIFGNFQAGSLEGVILNNVYLDVKINGTVGKANNAGAIWGQGRGFVTSNDTVIKYEYISPSDGPHGIDVGYITSAPNTSFSGSNNVFIATNGEELTGTWNESDYILYSNLEAFDIDDLEAYTESNYWTLTSDNLFLTINGVQYSVLP